MNKSEQYTPTNYHLAAELLAGKDTLKIGNNTYLERLAFNVIDGDTITIRFHATNIVTFTKDGTTHLTSGGFRTATTKERLNRYLPEGVAIRQLHSEWEIFTPNQKGYQAFHDGMTIDSTTGEVI